MDFDKTMSFNFEREKNAQTKEILKAFFVSLVSTPPTTPITSGKLDKEHGVIEVKTPAKNEIIGAIQKLLFIISDIFCNNCSIYFISLIIFLRSSSDK